MMTFNQKMTRDNAAALADVIAGIRPDWQRPGILAALHRAATRPDLPGLDQITDAAIAAAENSNIRTPAVIALDGNHWAAATKPSPQPPAFHNRPNLVRKCEACGYTQRDHGTCRRCGADTYNHIVTAEEQADINRRGLAKVRAAAAGQPWENLP